MPAQHIRTDIQPVILAGDMATYPIAREFHEAFGATTICVVPEPIALIAHSRFIVTHRVADMRAETLRDALIAIAREHAGQRVIVMANTDYLIERMEQVADELPENVICPLPPHDVMTRVSDKTTFAALCAEHGLDTPRTETVSLAGEGAIAPSALPFPVVAKPAASRDYAPFFEKGFEKVYFMGGQTELDALWKELRGAGFMGDFVVQELIMGDDTYQDSLTFYVNRAGEVAMCASAQVVLGDHRPELIGNPVSMITRPMPEQWEAVGSMLTEIGWYGFANVDIKRDARTGRTVFMDFNPRIGANSYYVAAAGVNPMAVLVEDVVDGKSAHHAIDKKVLYSRCPASLTRKYIADAALRREFDGIVRAGEVYNPVRYKADTLASRLYGFIMECNYVRKFARYYPELSETGF